MSQNRNHDFFQQATTIVIKIGSAQLVDKHGNIRSRWLYALCHDIAKLKAQGKQIIIVSSGAVALGRNALTHYAQQPSLAQKQAAAATGQITLCRSYEEAMEQYHLRTAQLLLTIEDCHNLQRQLNAKNTLKALLHANIIPIINENDTVATTELRFGDNDRLSAHICHLVKAEVLVLLSDVDGMYDKDPSQHPDAQHIATIDTIDEHIIAMAGPKQTTVGTGGMVTKLDAAKIATAAGCHLVIANGAANAPLGQLADIKTRCTWFIAQHSPSRASRQWLQHLSPNGYLHIDSGAAHAIHSGKNLLATGMTQVKGHFRKGDAVVIIDATNHAIAKGVCQYHAADLQKILGQHSDQIEKILGYHNGNAVVHSDNIVLLSN